MTKLLLQVSDSIKLSVFLSRLWYSHNTYNKIRQTILSVPEKKCLRLKEFDRLIYIDRLKKMILVKMCGLSFQNELRVKYVKNLHYESE